MEKENIALTLRLTAWILWTGMFLFAAIYLPFDIGIPEAMIVTLPFFSIPYGFGSLEIFRLLNNSSQSD